MDFILSAINPKYLLLVVLFSVLFHIIHGLFFISFVDMFKNTQNIISLAIFSFFMGKFLVFQWSQTVLDFSKFFGFYSDRLFLLLVIDIIIVPLIVLPGFISFRFSRLYSHIGIYQQLFRRNSDNSSA